ncbi:hypothetical protein KFL_007050040, partial [Klebsormidium nitens]
MQALLKKLKPIVLGIALGSGLASLLRWSSLQRDPPSGVGQPGARSFTIDVQNEGKLVLPAVEPTRRFSRRYLPAGRGIKASGGPYVDRQPDRAASEDLRRTAEAGCGGKPSRRLRRLPIPLCERFRSGGSESVSARVGGALAAAANAGKAQSSLASPPTVTMVQFEQYTWIFAIGTIVSFVCAFGIGANDVANSFATSVGSRALSMPQAIMIAAVCEFLGALLLGAGVTDTVKNKIANVALFNNTPELLMMGMLAVMITAAFWDNFACHLELPVSTTHTTVGAIVGMAWVIRGRYAVVWSKLNINTATGDNDFPYLKGMSIIFLQWIVSPLSSGVLVAILFFLLRTFVLRSPHSFIRAFYLFPVLVVATFFVVVMFIIQTGNKNSSWEKVSDSKSVWVSAVVAAGMGVLTVAVIMPFLYKAVHAADSERERVEADQKMEAARIEAGELDPKEAAIMRAQANEQAALQSKDTMWHRSMEKYGVNRFAQTNAGKFIFGNAFVKTLTYGASYDVHSAIGNDIRVGTIWEGAEVFDFKTERLFRYLQIFSAMVMSFAHGSNDVANA